MLKKEITFEDYEGKKRTMSFYFNLSKAELAEMEFTAEGKKGLQNYIDKIKAESDPKTLYLYFKDVIMKSYGVKSDDGLRFIKSAELSEGFTQTEAFSELIMELIGQEGAAVSFFKGILPAIPEDHKEKE